MVAMTMSIGFSMQFFCFVLSTLFALNYKFIEFNLTHIARIISHFFLKQSDSLTILSFLNLGVTTLDWYAIAVFWLLNYFKATRLIFDSYFLITVSFRVVIGLCPVSPGADDFVTAACELQIIIINYLYNWKVCIVSNCIVIRYNTTLLW